MHRGDANLMGHTPLVGSWKGFVRTVAQGDVIIDALIVSRRRGVTGSYPKGSCEDAMVK